MLKEMLESLLSTYITLDALDECTDREDLLSLLKDISIWSRKNIQILVTSREDKDIKDALNTLTTTSVNIQGSGIEADIEKHIDERLHKYDKLVKWQGEDRSEIRSNIAQGAQGM
jgi:ribosomal protein L12E/L44/L45/RPP1/RPP2